MSRTEARQPKSKSDLTNTTKLITTYNPHIPDITKLLSKHMVILHSDNEMKKLFPMRSISTVYRRCKNLKEIIAPSTYPAKQSVMKNSITSCK